MKHGLNTEEARRARPSGRRSVRLGEGRCQTKRRFQCVAFCGMNAALRSRFAASVAMLVALMALLGCEPKQGDKLRGLTHIPASAKVELGPASNKWMVELPEPLRHRFIEMIREEATHVDFRWSSEPAWGVFVVEGESFYWRGNGVVHPEPLRGRAWTSPLMQALINRSRTQPPGEAPSISSATRWKAILDELAKSPNLDSTPVERNNR